MNYYMSNDDCASAYTLEDIRRIDIFFFSIYRQQLVLQQGYRMHDLARSLRLFTDSASDLPRTDAYLTKVFGFSIRSWQLIGFAVFAQASGTGTSVLTPSQFSTISDQTLQRALVPILDELSDSIDGIKEVHRESRKDNRIIYDLHIPSVFLQKPLVRLSDGRFFALHYPWLLRGAMEGIFDIGRTRISKDFGAEFGLVFERYVGEILRECLTEAKFVPEAEMQRLTNESVCDYAVELPNAIVFIECKAVGYTASLPSVSAIENSNAISKIGSAFDQIASTIQLIQRSVIGGLFEPIGEKKLYGIVVTFRHIPSANHPDFRRSAIEPQSSLAPTLSSFLAHPAQVLDVSELEDMLSIGLSMSVGLDSLIEEKAALPPQAGYEWEAFLSRKMDETCRIPSLSRRSEEFMANHKVSYGLSDAKAVTGKGA